MARRIRIIIMKPAYRITTSIRVCHRHTQRFPIDVVHRSTELHTVIKCGGTGENEVGGDNIGGTKLQELKTSRGRRLWIDVAK